MLLGGYAHAITEHGQTLKIIFGLINLRHMVASRPSIAISINHVPCRIKAARKAAFTHAASFILARSALPNAMMR